MKNYFFISILTVHFLTGLPPAYAFPDNQETFSLGIRKTQGTVRIDGSIDEADWKLSPVAGDFWLKWPTDTTYADSKTEVRVLYDENFLYFSAVCFDSRRVINTLKRDAGFWDSDAFGIILDPVNERTNGFLFGINVGSSQYDALIAINEASEQWDAKWYSSVQKYEDRWVVEVAIPFKSLRYNEHNLNWGINFMRIDAQRNQFSTWAKVPRQMRSFDLGFTGKMQWDLPPAASKSNVVLIPYITGSTYRDHAGEKTNEWNGNIGLDAKIAVTSGLNLDLTLNPDFSQVDVDVQVTNLSRFNIFFPERRNFFLENSDLFANLGTEDVRPFFSRKIGISQGKTIPIYFGARLSGNLDNDWRIGVMSLQTGKGEGIPSNNYSVAVLQRKLLKRSNVRGFFINRQAMGSKVEEAEANSFNMVGGLEFTYLSQDGKWRSDAMYHHSFNTVSQPDNAFLNLGGQFRSRNDFVALQLSRVGENYITDVGFVPRLYNYDAARDSTLRKGYYQLNGRLFHDFFPKNNPKINLIWVGLTVETFLNMDGSLNEANVFAGSGTRLANRGYIDYNVTFSKVALPFATDLIGGEEALPAQTYQFVRGSMAYGSDPRKNFSWEVNFSGGSFYNGSILSYGGNINFRRQPWGNFGVEINQNHVQLPAAYGSANLTLISPRIEISFTETMFWTTFLQYNTQADNFNINSRFQWRFKPMSDLFIVYTDNYVSQDFRVKNRGLVIKLNFWLNL